MSLVWAAFFNRVGPSECYRLKVDASTFLRYPPYHEPTHTRTRTWKLTILPAAFCRDLEKVIDSQILFGDRREGAQMFLSVELAFRILRELLFAYAGAVL